MAAGFSGLWRRGSSLPSPSRIPDHFDPRTRRAYFGLSFSECCGESVEATFGLTVRYLGFALGTAMALGYCAAFGTLLPHLQR